jgi:hypothetical protein
MQDPVPGISAIPDEQNARYFHVIIAGPEGVCSLLSILFVNPNFRVHLRVVFSNWSFFYLKNIQWQRQRCAS